MFKRPEALDQRFLEICLQNSVYVDIINFEKLIFVLPTVNVSNLRNETYLII